MPHNYAYFSVCCKGSGTLVHVLTLEVVAALCVIIQSV